MSLSINAFFEYLLGWYESVKTQLLLRAAKNISDIETKLGKPSVSIPAVQSITEVSAISLAKLVQNGFDSEIFGFACNDKSVRRIYNWHLNHSVLAVAERHDETVYIYGILIRKRSGVPSNTFVVPTPTNADREYHWIEIKDEKKLP